jgi:type I restriction enzyme S subunit
MVEWKKLDTLLDFEQPTPYLVKSTEYDNLYDTPVLTAGQSLLLGYTNETDGIYEASKENPCIIFDDFTTSFHWIDYNFKVKSSAMKMLRPQKDVNFRYVYYSMCGINFVPGGHQRHWISKYSQFEIPMPAPSEQNRIVGILDTFTASIDNLKEQIALRRKQYEYYRDQLLDLEGKEGVEMKSLGEIGEFIRGNGIQKSDFVEEGFSCIHYGQIHAKYGFSAEETISKIDEVLYKRCKKAKKGDVVLATTSEDAEGVAKPFVWLGEEDAAVSGDAFIYHHNQIGKFMGYQFQTHKFMQFKVKYATGAKVVRISGDNMAKFEIALPSIEDQQRIVSILDTFEASIQNLEAQLSQREKQYEYYRNKLLTFE